MFSSETTLVTGDSNGSSYVWDLSSGGSLTSTFKDPNSNGINGIAFNASSDTYAMADANGNIYLWNGASGTITATLSNGSRDNDRVAISPDGSMVAVGSSGGSTYLWKVGGGKATPPRRTASTTPAARTCTGSRSARTATRWRPATPTAARTCGTCPPASSPAR